MFSYIWPIAMVVLANTFYQIAAKSVPDKIDPFASVTLTYIVGAVTSAILYFVLNKDADILREYSNLNWAPFVMGITVVGLEAGMIYAYKAGWPVNAASMTQSTILAIVLVFVGYLVFKEPISWNKVAGIAVCLAGLALMNYK
ncbi:MAG: EamA family transporter [Eubacterium sp.]|nr:EamA family transporter [Eubacterium sp.]